MPTQPNDAERAEHVLITGADLQSLRAEIEHHISLGEHGSISTLALLKDIYRRARSLANYGEIQLPDPYTGTGRRSLGQFLQYEIIADPDLPDGKVRFVFPNGYKREFTIYTEADMWNAGMNVPHGNS